MEQQSSGSVCQVTGTRLTVPVPNDHQPVRRRVSSFSSSVTSLSWSQQQPLIHIHLLFMMLLMASIWTYCMSCNSDLLSAAFFFLISAPNSHPLSHLYQLKHTESHLRSQSVNSGSNSVLALDQLPAGHNSNHLSPAGLTTPGPVVQRQNSWSSFYPSGQFKS